MNTKLSIVFTFIAALVLGACGGSDGGGGVDPAIANLQGTW